MTFTLAIVEDEDRDAERLRDFLLKYEAEENIKFSIARFRTAGEFLKNYRAVYSIIFMDIQLPDLSGMDAAAELRKADKMVPLIFVTNVISYAQKGYEVNAVSFLLKPVSYNDVYLKVKKALAISVINEPRKVMVTLANGVSSVSADKLMYVEVMGHKLKYHLKGEVLEASGSLSVVHKQLEKYGFLRCNRCYLVNPLHIIGVRGLDLQIGNEILKISRPQRKKFMTDLTNWLSGGK